MATQKDRDKSTEEQTPESDGRMVATSAINIDGVNYQKGEYVDTSSLPKAEFDYYVEQGVLWTETQWIGKYKEEPAEHEDEGDVFPKPQGTMTTAQGATAVQDSNPALRREGDPRVETTTSGQTPVERTAATASTTTGTESSGSASPAADARKTTTTSSTSAAKK